MKENRAWGGGGCGWVVYGLEVAVGVLVVVLRCGQVGDHMIDDA